MSTKSKYPANTGPANTTSRVATSRRKVSRPPCPPIRGQVWYDTDIWMASVRGGIIGFIAGFLTAGLLSLAL